MRFTPFFAAGVSFASLAVALPEAYSDVVDYDIVEGIAKRAPIDNTDPNGLCNGTIHLDTRVQYYTVPPGVTLTDIAKQFQRGICDIAKANNIQNIDYVQAGTKLTIPAQVCIPDSSSCVHPAPPPATAICIKGGPGFYIIQSGDTLGQVASSFKITLDALVSANKVNVPNPNVISVGQILNVPLCANSACELSPYKIKSGDTFHILGETYGSSEGQVRALNPGVVPTQLQVDQVITLASWCR